MLNDEINLKNPAVSWLTFPRNPNSARENKNAEYWNADYSNGAKISLKTGEI